MGHLKIDNFTFFTLPFFRQQIYLFFIKLNHFQQKLHTTCIEYFTNQVTPSPSQE